MSTETATSFETERLNIGREAPALSRGLVALERELRIDPVLRELVKLRASILNGCAYCIDMHTKDARKAGESSSGCTQSPPGTRRPSSRARTSRACAHRRRHADRRHARPRRGLRRSRTALRPGGTRPPGLADRRHQRLEPNRSRDSADGRRLSALNQRTAPRGPASSQETHGAESPHGDTSFAFARGGGDRMRRGSELTRSRAEV